MIKSDRNSEVIKKNVCFCIKNNFKISINTPDAYNMEIHDVSEWMEAEGYFLPERYKVEVEINIDLNKFNLFLNTNSITLVTSESFGLSKDSKLPQGIYKFKINPLDSESGGCGTEYYIHKAVLSDFYCKYNNLLVTESYENIKHIGLMLKQIEILADSDNVLRAKKLINILKRELIRYDCEC